jgi:SAM-dependent methyltransferase
MRHAPTYEELLAPPRPGSWAALKWGMVARLLRTVAPLSDGLSIGYRHGFDSGPMLDYVYRNRARGRWGVGRVLDRIHLSSIGWRGIRRRKTNLQAVLRATIADVVARERRPARVVDIASGPGRYLLELVRELGGDAVDATLRDRDEAGLAQGRFLARDLGVAATFVRGDAFDPDALAALTPRPDVVVVSGLYELFPDDALVRRSLDGIRRLLPPGGSLVYTNQPTHPQLELIARVLPNREGRPWVMRLRPQAEMDGLVTAAGFAPRRTLGDRWGIFTVSVAVRR